MERISGEVEELKSPGDDGGTFRGAEAEDLLPEYCQYRDEGCELAPSCLNCPFPRCFEDQPRSRSGWLREVRDREIVRLHGEKKSNRELAEKFRISLRTVQRALRRYLPEERRKR